MPAFGKTFSCVEITPSAPCRGGLLPRPLPLCLLLRQNFSLPPLCVSPDSCKKRSLARTAFYQLPGIRTSFGWAAVLIVSSLLFPKKKKKIRKGDEIPFSPGSLPPWGASEVMGPLCLILGNGNLVTFRDSRSLALAAQLTRPGQAYLEPGRFISRDRHPHVCWRTSGGGGE